MVSLWPILQQSQRRILPQERCIRTNQRRLDPIQLGDVVSALDLVQGRPDDRVGDGEGGGTGVHRDGSLSLSLCQWVQVWCRADMYNGELGCELFVMYVGESRNAWPRVANAGIYSIVTTPRSPRFDVMVASETGCMDQSYSLGCTASFGPYSILSFNSGSSAFVLSKCGPSWSSRVTPSSFIVPAISSRMTGG